jgi:hypothetical protein
LTSCAACTNYESPVALSNFPELDIDKIGRAENARLPALRVLKLAENFHKRALPPTTPNTLHTLVLYNCDPDPTLFLAFIRNHEASLRRVFFVGIYACGKDGNPILDDIGWYIPRLKCVYIRGGATISSRFLASLPLSTIEVSIEIDGYINPTAILDFIKKQTVPTTPLELFAIKFDDPDKYNDLLSLASPRISEAAAEDELSIKCTWCEVDWLRLKKSAENLGVKFTWTIVSARLHFSKSTGLLLTLESPEDEHRFRSGPSTKDPVWSQL